MKLTKKLLAMALAGVMLLTILTGCSGGKTGDRLVEEYMTTFLSETFGLSGVPITHDVPEIKTVAEKFDPSWLDDKGNWTIKPLPADKQFTTLKTIFNDYSDGYTVLLFACKVDSKQSELNQTMRVMANIFTALPVYPIVGSPTAAKCATRLVTRGETSYRIAVLIYERTAN